MTRLTTPKIDAHQHFWRYKPEEYRWINDDMSVLKQDFLSDKLAPLLGNHAIQGTVLVQACPSVEETQWLLEEAEKSGFVKAVIGWVDLASPQLADQLAMFQHQPLLRGIRHQVQDEPDPARWLTDSAVDAGVRQIQQQGYVYELLVTHRHLAEAARFAARHDDHQMVLDHCGKPDLSKGAAHWARQIAPLAALPHVYCKLSGLLTEPRPDSVTPHDLLDWFDAALDVFGSERLIFGSDWPVCLLEGSYEASLTLCQQATSSLSADEQAAIFGGNACRVFGL